MFHPVKFMLIAVGQFLRRGPVSIQGQPFVFNDPDPLHGILAEQAITAGQLTISKKL